MRNAYIEALKELTKKNNNIVSVGTDSLLEAFGDFILNYPEKFFDVGICESNAVAIAAGLASCGKIPFLYSMGPFLVNRAYEFIRIDVCLQNQNVKLVGWGAGINNNKFGPTHHVTEDIAALRVLPNLMILSPASPKEVYKTVEAAAKYIGPVYIRLGKGFEREIYHNDCNFEIGKGIVIKEGTDVTIFSTGAIISEVLDAYDILIKEGISVNVVNIPVIKPIDNELIISEARKTGRVVTVEEHNIYGGFGGAVAEVLCKEHISVKFGMIALKDCFCKGYGTYNEIKKLNGISSIQIIDEVRKILY